MSESRRRCKWERMRDILLTTAQDACGISGQPPRHKETWWWNEEMAKAVKNKRYLRTARNTEQVRMESYIMKQREIVRKRLQ